MRALRAYTVRYERDEDGWWVATVKEVAGCHTQGRTIDQARRRIREALDLFVSNADTAELINDVVLSAQANALLKRVRRTRELAEEQATRLQESTAQAAQLLTRQLGISNRDAGELLDLSHQRVSQLAIGYAAKAKKLSDRKVTGMTSRKTAAKRNKPFSK